MRENKIIQNEEIKKKNNERKEEKKLTAVEKRERER